MTATLGSTNTGSLGATFTAAASVASANLVITAVTGLISIGDTVSGSGITDAPTILSQASGTTGGAGTYVLSTVETCTGGTVTCFGTVLDLTVVSTYVSPGDTVVKSTDFPSWRCHYLPVDRHGGRLALTGSVARPLPMWQAARAFLPSASPSRSQRLVLELWQSGRRLQTPPQRRT